MHFFFKILKRHINNFRYRFEKVEGIDVSQTRKDGFEDGRIQGKSEDNQASVIKQKALFTNSLFKKINFFIILSPVIK
jgi:hypothetical protein